MKNVILFGFKGCGKTHYGRLLASRLNYPFIDTDHLIESRCADLTCREIVHKIGEAEFRILEKKAIASLNIDQDTVISVGGGAVLDPDNVHILKKMGTLIYLEESKEILKQRIFNASYMPSYLDENDPLASFEKMYRERKPLYEKIPSVRLNIEQKTEQEVLALLENMRSNG
ncbi:MAG TPA: shikimate kinase [Rhabdochlamydiaceae bacterium]|nr:shikimate kinase [Rhabdochlamydiaceae bacterium]